MVSRKKAAGKVRKARNAAKAKARKGYDPTTFMQGLFQLECKHGVEPHPSTNICLRFAFAFGESFGKCNGRQLLNTDCILDAKNATWDEFAEVWNDAAKMALTVSFFLCDATQAVLKGDYGHARYAATFARFFEQYIAVELKETQAVFNWPKIHETQSADMHTLVKFLRRRIPCSCLDEKYEEVKSITKVGHCYYSQCKFPGGMTDRSNTKYCSRCRFITYCSRECQVADWTNHRGKCDRAVAMIAELEVEARQREEERARAST